MNSEEYSLPFVVNEPKSLITRLIESIAFFILCFLVFTFVFPLIS